MAGPSVTELSPHSLTGFGNHSKVLKAPSLRRDVELCHWKRWSNKLPWCLGQWNCQCGKPCISLYSDWRSAREPTGRCIWFASWVTLQISESPVYSLSRCLLGFSNNDKWKSIGYLFNAANNLPETLNYVILLFELLQWPLETGSVGTLRMGMNFMTWPHIICSVSPSPTLPPHIIFHPLMSKAQTFFTLSHPWQWDPPAPESFTDMLCGRKISCPFSCLIESSLKLLAEASRCHSPPTYVFPIMYY